MAIISQKTPNYPIKLLTKGQIYDILFCFQGLQTPEFRRGLPPVRGPGVTRVALPRRHQSATLDRPWYCKRRYTAKQRRALGTTTLSASPLRRCRAERCRRDIYVGSIPTLSTAGAGRYFATRLRHLPLTTETSVFEETKKSHSL